MLDPKHLANTPYIIAEIASSHEGDPALARKLIGIASQTGADAVKLQLFNRDDLIVPSHPKYAAFGEIEISTDLWRDLLAYALTLEIDVIVEVYDLASLELASEFSALTAIKIPTADFGNLALIDAALALNKPLLAGSGGARIEEISQFVDHVKQKNAVPILLEGFQSYPTALNDCALANIQRFQQQFDCPVGYADHIDAEDALYAMSIPAMAFALGARVIEKHLTDDRGRKGRDYYSALNPDEFAQFVAFMRNIASTLPSSVGEMGEAATQYRVMMKKQMVAKRQLKVGEPLTAEMVTFKRIGVEGILPQAAGMCYGQVLAVTKAVDEPIFTEDLQ